jgi:hypothetical protein
VFPVWPAKEDGWRPIWPSRRIIYFSEREKLTFRRNTYFSVRDGWPRVWPWPNFRPTMAGHFAALLLCGNCSFQW